MAKEADTPRGGSSGSARRRRKNRNSNNGSQNNDTATNGKAIGTKASKGTVVALAEHSGSEPGTPTVTGTPRSESQGGVRSQALDSATLKTRLLVNEFDVVKARPQLAGRVKRRRWFIAGLVFGGLAALTGILYANPTKSVHIDRMHDMLGELDISSILPDSLLPDDFIQDITRLL
ncbi:hypothetical protein FBU31_006658, partial [Coemansia sp. 'formosensis']